MEDNLKNQENPVIANTLSDQEKLIEQIKQEAINETMKKLEPLLEKLQQVVSGQQGVEQQAAPVLPTNLQVSEEEQIKQMQRAADDRVRSLEQKIAKRMQKKQARMSQYK
ncbi:MAG: hypothetical protein AB8E82_04035 [Aureispira sp.]